MENIPQMKNMNLAGKRVVIREDLNVPIKDGKIGSDKRIRAAVPTIKMADVKGAGVVLLSHLGRPVEGEYDPVFSLEPVAARLSDLLGKHVHLVKNIEDAIAAPGQVVLLENIRFMKGEKKNSEELARKLAALGDVYVMDAFGAAHRAHASTEGAIRFAAEPCAGPLLVDELEAIGKILHKPRRPLAAVIGGSKVSTKLALLENLLGKVDRLIVGGGIANTFLAAAGFSVGASLCETDLIPDARRIMEAARADGKELPLPADVVVAKELAAGVPVQTVKADAVPADGMILDVGPQTVALYSKMLADAATVVWNGPVGAFETEPFGAGTRALAEMLAKSPAYVLVGGGDSVAAVEQYGLADKMGYISTGGGASLELLEGKTLPSVAALEARS
ncbi:MAG: phosphoglycerate kinase [Desulfovibrionaceae bacterium]|nr:phosphoglycerate kinase [Desulfovibrionaceae bacterium]